MEKNDVIMGGIALFLITCALTHLMTCSLTWDKNLNDRYKSCVQKCKDVRDCQDILRNR
jgi:hypothetical protein